MGDLKIGYWTYQRIHSPTCWCCSDGTFTCDISIWSGLPFNMIPQFKEHVFQKEKSTKWRPYHFSWSKLRSQAASLLWHLVGWGSYSGLAGFREKKCGFCLSFLEECQHHFVKRICGINIYLSGLLTVLSGIVGNLHTQERCLRHSEEIMEGFQLIDCIQ